MQIAHGGLYTADLAPHIGTKPSKVRPVLVVQSVLLSRTGHPSTWVLPCTTRLAEEILSEFRRLAPLQATHDPAR
jgi:mRNA-degrading endonuclease toxin of MazEF toxin-antitoxin module